MKCIVVLASLCLSYAVHVDSATIHATAPDERQVKLGDVTTTGVNQDNIYIHGKMASLHNALATEQPNIYAALMHFMVHSLLAWSLASMGVSTCSILATSPSIPLCLARSW